WLKELSIESLLARAGRRTARSRSRCTAERRDPMILLVRARRRAGSRPRKEKCGGACGTARRGGGRPGKKRGAQGIPPQPPRVGGGDPPNLGVVDGDLARLRGALEVEDGPAPRV